MLIFENDFLSYCLVISPDFRSNKKMIDIFLEYLSMYFLELI